MNKKEIESFIALKYGITTEWPSRYNLSLIATQEFGFLVLFNWMTDVSYEVVGRKYSSIQSVIAGHINQKNLIDEVNEFTEDAQVHFKTKKNKKEIMKNLREWIIFAENAYE